MGQHDKNAEGFQLNVADDATLGPGADFALAQFAWQIYQSRRERDKNVSTSGLFQDPAWDILLDLFISHSENKCISVMSAGLAGHVPPSTALRWIWALEEAKLVERKTDVNDRRRNFVFLSAKGLTYMRDVLALMRDRLQPDLIKSAT